MYIVYIYTQIYIEYIYTQIYIYIYTQTMAHLSISSDAFPADDPKTKCHKPDLMGFNQQKYGDLMAIHGISSLYCGNITGI